MFGIIRPCRHRLGEELGRAWLAQLCGLCLALRDDHGQSARLATNYDGLIISALVEAQSTASPTRRVAGPCPLRGMKRADVATGDCVRLAATVSLVLAAAKVRDHVDDHDGVAGTAGFRPAARALARRWARQGESTGAGLGFDTGVLVTAVDRQTEIESAAVVGTPLLEVTEPTETATAAAFGHTAILAGKPGNQAALIEVGRLFGRIAHLVDAVEDLGEDLAQGKWNPLAATGTDVAEAHRLCTDALLGIELALAEVEFTDKRLIHKLLTHELGRSVTRTFGGHGPACTTHGAATAPNPGSVVAPMSRWRRRGPDPWGPPPGYGYGPPPGYGQGYYGPARRRSGCCLPCCEGCVCCGEGCCCCEESCCCCEESCCDC
ncbi:DUF5685 family protein [Nocardia concava]|uniref:DUF5685 family protein n=1 Tax=Nocardia concava TaxID=257281 RepID=UPI0002D3B2F9|nr:DUF5685 family protein [Nocardia concava]